MPIMLDRESIIGIGISLVFATKGFISNQVGGEDGRGVRWEWWLSEKPRLLLLGNAQDPLLESLWSVLAEMTLFGTARTLKFDLATGLNFSLYVERPRLEHLYNVKRTWLTISQLQSESRYLTPIPHLQWFREGGLKRQVRLCEGEELPHYHHQPSNHVRKVGVGAGIPGIGNGETPVSRSEADLYWCQQLEDDSQATTDLPLVLLLQFGLSVSGPKARSPSPRGDALGA